MKTLNGTILIVDDDPDILTSSGLFLKQFTTGIIKSRNPEEIPEILEKENIDIILMDMNYSPGNTDGREGLYWLKKIVEIDKDIVVIIITAYGNIQIAVDTLKAGALDFVVKPWDNEKLLATLNAAMEVRKSKKEIKILKQTQQQLNTDLFGTSTIIGESFALRKVMQMVDKVAKTDADVLLLGENGTGKDLIAQEIHKRSQRAHNTFIKVDMGSLSSGLFESELFGHVKGAFTDAKENRIGRFELASGGSIFLDEIGNLPIDLQVKLLTVLQNRKISRVGSAKEIDINLRLICATNKTIHQLVDNGEFREDLYYRINTVEIYLPPLRERVEDIPVLFNHFLQIYSHKYEKGIIKTPNNIIKKLKNYNWPGNIRELQHMVERAVILSHNNTLDMDDMFTRNEPAILVGTEPASLILEEIEKNIINLAISRTNGHMTKAAKELGITRSALYRRIEKYEI